MRKRVAVTIIRWLRLSYFHFNKKEKKHNIFFFTLREIEHVDTDALYTSSVKHAAGMGHVAMGSWSILTALSLLFVEM